MEPAPSGWQSRLVAASYAVAGTVSAILIYQRYLLYVRHPDDVAAAGGMYAGGDMMLEAFIGFLLLFPTFLLVIVLRKYEPAYNTYYKGLVGFALTAPLAIVTAIPGGSWVIGEICIARIVVTPFAVAAYVVSRIASPFRSSGRRIVHALLIEVLTVASAITLLFLSSKFHRG